MQAPMDWEYVAGFLDGEGTVGMWAAAGRPQAIHRLAWYNTHLETLEQMQAFMGCGQLRASRYRGQPSHYRQQYTLTIGNRLHLGDILPQLVPFLIEKRPATEAIWQHLAPWHYAVFCEQSPPWTMGWSYLAAFLDGEGTIAMPRPTAKQQKTNGLSWVNTYHPVLQRIQTFLGCGQISSRSHSGFKGQKVSYTLAVTKQADALMALEGMLPYLRQKQGKAEEMLARLRVQLEEPRGRNRDALAEISSTDLYRLYEDEGLSFAAIGARYGVTGSAIARLFRLYGLPARPVGGGHMKGRPKSPETIAKMKATRAKMWEDPAYAARMRTQLARGAQAPHTQGWTKPTIQGERHPRSKLSNAQTAEIREQYATGTTSLGKLAQAYGVSERTIFNIVHHTIRRVGIEGA